MVPARPDRALPDLAGRALPHRTRATASPCSGGGATRYNKTATIYLAGLRLAAIFIWSAR